MNAAPCSYTYTLPQSLQKGTLKANVVQRMMKPFHMRKISLHQSLYSSDNVTPDKEQMDLR